MKNFKTIDPHDLSTQQVHKILLSSITPRPIALASTIDSDGNVNLFLVKFSISDGNVNYFW